MYSNPPLGDLPRLYVRICGTSDVGQPFRVPAFCPLFFAVGRNRRQEMGLKRGNFRPSPWATAIIIDMPSALAIDSVVSW